MKCANDIGSERVNLLVSEKSLNRQLQLRSENSQRVEDLKYRLDGTAAKRCRA